jgi:hypothetical protein
MSANRRRFASCRSCGDSIDPEAFARARDKGEIPSATPGGPRDGYCLGCYLEVRCGQCPNVTGPMFAPPGTGLVERQRIGSIKTNS